MSPKLEIKRTDVRKINTKTSPMSSIFFIKMDRILFFKDIDFLEKLFVYQLRNKKVV